MDRLTNVNESMPLLKSENFIYWQNVYDRLAAYEDIGIVPETLSEILDDISHFYNADGSVMTLDDYFLTAQGDKYR